MEKKKVQGLEFRVYMSYSLNSLKGGYIGGLLWGVLSQILGVWSIAHIGILSKAMKKQAESKFNLKW